MGGKKYPSLGWLARDEFLTLINKSESAFTFLKLNPFNVAPEKQRLLETIFQKFKAQNKSEAWLLRRAFEVLEQTEASETIKSLYPVDYKWIQFIDSCKFNEIEFDALERFDRYMEDQKFEPHWCKTKKKLIEGRKPNFNISAFVADATATQVVHII